MTTEALKLDAYIRVSRVAGRSGESFISPSVQREQIEGWAKAHGSLVTWHEPELDASGGTMERPVFEQIMQRVRAGQSDGVIVAKLDRFARTLVGALATLEQFEDHGAVLVSVAENLDLSTAMGKAFLRILLVFAELERDRIRDSWQVASASAIDRGIHIAKFTPFGYEKGADKRLVPSHEAPAVHEAFLMRAAHATRTEVARRLDEIAPRPGEGRWTIPMVERIIKNRVYMGYAYRGEHLNRSAHPPIVTPAEWQAANLATVRVGPRGKIPNLLGGIVRCAACRSCSRRGERTSAAATFRTTAVVACTRPAPVRHRRASMRARSSATWSRSGASRWPQRPWPYSRTPRACRMPQSSSHSPRRS